MADDTVKVRVIPRGSKNEIVGWRGDALCVKVTSPPLEGAANEALVKFLANVLQVRKSDVRIVNGERSREKLVAVSGLTAEEIRARLGVH
ncbi:MAG: DUF167 domain-containing protein [Armatimonadota bacterium]|nr:DUF167 domain-containing protein [Armatimonadota bacterium]